MEWLNVLFSAAGGGVFGLAGGLLQKFLDMRHQAQLAKTELEVLRVKNAHDLVMRDKDRAFLIEEAKAAFAVAELKAQTERDVASYSAMQESYKHDSRSYATDEVASKYPLLFAIVDFLRGVTRPALTAYLNLVLTILTGYLTYMLFITVPELQRAQLFIKDQTLLIGVFNDLVDALIFMSTTSTMWWFAARGIQSKKG